MKKQLMVLVLCLALTATVATAKSTTPVKVKATIPVAVQTKEAEVKLTPEQIERQKFEEKMAKDREELFSKLGLSKEQREKADALHKASKESAEPLFAKLHEEKAKYHELKAQKACPVKIAEQKLKVKEAKHALKAHMKKSRAEFEAILDKDQLAKFKEWKEQKKAEWEKEKCQCDDKCPCKGKCKKDCKCKCHHHPHHPPCFLLDEDEKPCPCTSKIEKTKPACPCEKK